MRAIRSVLLLLAAVGGFLALAAPARAAAPGYQKIVCVGDCITLGQWWNEDVGKGTCWVDRFAAGEAGAKVVNAGRDGLESKHFWYVKELLKENPDADAFILFLGMNDLRGMKDSDPAEATRIAGRVAYMIDLIRQKRADAQILLVAPQRIAPAHLSAKWKAEGFGEHTEVMLELLTLSLKKVAEEKKTRFLALTEKFPVDLLPDGVHPGAEGHALIAKLVAEEIDHPEVTDARPVFAEAKQVPPPAEGKPYASQSATELVLAGIRGDLQAFKGPDALPEPPAAPPAAPVVSKFISREDTRDLLSDEGYRFGQAAGQALVEAVEKELEWQEAAGVEAVYDKLYGPESGEIVKITYDLPVPPRADIFMTQVDTPDHQEYGILGATVNWQAVESPLVYNDVRMNKGEEGQESARETVAVAPRMPAPAPAATPAEAAPGIGMVAQRQQKAEAAPMQAEQVPESAELPEMSDESIQQILMPAGSQVPGVPGLAAYAVDLTKKKPETAKKPSMQPLAVPGYAVFVHTRPEKL